ncbi:transposase [Streptomyces sp. S07_1.15]|uniref:transposase n=1 Tax=Streptomyces sp. S07_1.15 TaxID=2873925 RepID=UPI001D15A272|nr:transposase [Streptomyces sp. S07_1.15]MCC3650643.1 transposase [Streptomyces sp. S07_1.15]
MGNKNSRSRRYSEEFKRDAVALVHSSGRTVTEVARELGVSAEGLRNWVKQDTVDRGQGAPGELTSAEREELRRLRRQNREQAETIEVLRKAAVFFAQESDR